MLTSIKALRESSADQSRVTRVLNALKKKWPEYTEEMPFPVAFIMLSNSASDTQWVLDSSNSYPTHTSFMAKNANAVAKEMEAAKLPYNTAPKSKAEAQQVINVYARFLPGVNKLVTGGSSMLGTLDAVVSKAQKASKGKPVVVDNIPKANPAAAAKAKELKSNPVTAEILKSATGRLAISKHLKTKTQVPVAKLSVQEIAKQLLAMTKKDKLAVLANLALLGKGNDTMVAINPNSKDSRKPTIVTIVL